MQAHPGFAYAEQARQTLIRKALALEREHALDVQFVQRAATQRLFLGDYLGDLGDEPRIDSRVFANLLHRHP